jgi:hypothetical protein
MKKSIMMPIILVALILTQIPQSLAGSITETVTYHWKSDIEINDSTLPIEIFIPTKLIIEGIPDRSKQGETVTIKFSTELIEGANIILTEETFDIDEELASSVKNGKDIDLSVIKPLLEKILTKIISAELELGEDKAGEFSSILTEYTYLTLKSQLEVETEIEGQAVSEPRIMQLWFDGPKTGTIRISQTAKDKVSLTYNAYWSILISIDFEDSVYDDPLVGPLINQLSKLIGLPLERNIGRIQGEPAISHTITVFSFPKLTTTQIALIILVIIAACIIGVMLILKYPKKPKWR